MKAQIISLTVVTTLVAFGAGCASTSAPPPPAYSQYPANRQPSDPNQTARGAVAGAVAGALIGGIIGNNSDHGNSEKGAAIGAVAGGIAGAVIGHRTDQREAAAYRAQDVAYTVHAVPAAPYGEPADYPTARPDSRATWIRGHYVYTGNGYHWQPGRWEVAPQGSGSWVQPAWHPTANGGFGYVYVRGHWQ